MCKLKYQYLKINYNYISSILMKLTNFIALLAIIFITACSSSETIFLDSNYQKKSLDNDFVVLPLKSSWLPGESESKISYTDEDYFIKSLEAYFSTNTHNSVEVLNQEYDVDKADFKTQKLTTNKHSIDVNLPPKSILDSFSERFAYFFEGYDFTVSEKVVNGSSYAGQEKDVIVKRKLNFKTQFFLFDKETSEIISWGKISDDVRISDKPSYEDYEEVVKKVSNKIISESPFVTK